MKSSKNRRIEHKNIATFVEKKPCNVSPKKAKAYRRDPHLHNKDGIIIQVKVGYSIRVRLILPQSNDDIMSMTNGSG